MKNWFKNLKPAVRKIILIVFWIIVGVSFFIIGYTPEDSSISNICVWVFLVGLVFSIIFSVWSARLKKETDMQSKNNSAVASHYTSDTATPIYPPIY